MRKLNKMNLSIVRAIVKGFRKLMDSTEPEIKAALFHLDIELMKTEAWLEGHEDV